MQVEVVKAFKWSPHGWDVVAVDCGIQELPDEAAQIALREGWAKDLPAPRVTALAKGEGAPSGDPAPAVPARRGRRVA